jgi:alanyl-tRNA synthetase
MFYDVRPEEGRLKGTHDDMVKSFRLMEVWNDVFMEFNKTAEGKYEKMAQQNVDTGMGLERAVTVLSGKENVFDTDLFLPIIFKIEELCGKKYSADENKKAMRIISDHIKASVFIVADGITPSNVGQGYVLRRLIRRAIRQGHILGINENFTAKIADVAREMYGAVYPEIMEQEVMDVIKGEELKFRKTLKNGLKVFESQIASIKVQSHELKDKIISGKMAFDLYQSYGFPLELVLELAKENDLAVDEVGFGAELQKHQQLSRTASAGMFRGGLADTKEKTTQLHTVAHLMLAGLRKVLGPHVHQKGSNINGERIRFDFSHPGKMTDEQKKAVEEYVNMAIQAKVSVEMNEMSPDEAREAGAEGEFGHKYGDIVKVFDIPGFSKEICGGPHVKNTADIEGVFKIKKEESSSAGVRRIKAAVV